MKIYCNSLLQSRSLDSPSVSCSYCTKAQHSRHQYYWRPTLNSRLNLGATGSNTVSSPSTASTSSSDSSVQTEAAVSPRKEAQLTLEQYKEIYDRLIAIFKERPRDDWKKLIVFSKQWGQHQQGVFDRLKELADKETDVDKKMQLRKIFRSLQGVNDEVARYNKVLQKFAEAADDEWEAIVAVHRGDLQKPFFEHLQCLVISAKDDKEKKDGLVLINTRLLALVTNHDSIEANTDKLEAASEVYRDLLGSINSVEEADAKMAELAKQGKIDPAFLQITAKAYGAARDTNMTKDEAKWVAYKLYRQARDHFERQQPKEKRILEYLLTIRDPVERTNQLDKAITPGPTPNTDTHDYMWTTPQRLYAVLDGTIKAFEAMQEEAGKQMGSSKATSTPVKIRDMRLLRDEVVRRYL
ncbi:hypothetical protein CEUSTIGMA_g1211.t1 [Chlamydomonas eustigma]|uniref:Uncharacterized protein n=1 Tax=Chlamydomonas eustigma TaxID=1157962 RepID=A0A250WTA5_9CHLO|nr:hypothetical protein CEUSTIGMA_g1211.t1 [Chlamydomonas eustigma]|eukprot:GAX73760.1 hypothetical protein CEUSTIGMA_g1211.t1 [Chlamydomonas eustigma]